MLDDYKVAETAFQDSLKAIINDKSIPFEERWSLFKKASDIGLTYTGYFNDYKWTHKYNFSAMFYYSVFQGKINDLVVSIGQVIDIDQLERMCDNHGLLVDFNKFAEFYMANFIGKLIM